MKKRLYLTAVLFGLVIFLPGIYSLTNGPVTAINPGHNSTQIFIQVGNPLNSQYITLQNAIDAGYLIGANISSVPLSSINPVLPYHLANKILVNVTSGGINYTMTLQEAVDNHVFANGASRSYNTTLPPGGEYGESVNVNTTTSIKNLQKSITNTDFNYSWRPISSSCTGTCGSVGTQDSYCSHNGAQVSDGLCYTGKPSVSCNTRGCVWSSWAFAGGCGPPIYTLPCNPGIVGTPCSPAGSGKVCFMDLGSPACYTRRGVSTCS